MNREGDSMVSFLLGRKACEGVIRVVIESFRRRAEGAREEGKGGSTNSHRHYFGISHKWTIWTLIFLQKSAIHSLPSILEVRVEKVHLFEMRLSSSKNSPQMTAPRQGCVLETSMGVIIIELYPTHAPKTSQNFYELCKRGYYSGTIFHRVVGEFIVQGGDPTGTGRSGQSIYGGTFEDEIVSPSPGWAERGELIRGW